MNLSRALPIAGIWVVMKRPHEVHLSREEGEALRQRLDRKALTAADLQVLGHVLE
jgi:hypothetical protein